MRMYEQTKICYLILGRKHVLTIDGKQKWQQKRMLSCQKVGSCISAIFMGFSYTIYTFIYKYNGIISGVILI